MKELDSKFKTGTDGEDMIITYLLNKKDKKGNEQFSIYQPDSRAKNYHPFDLLAFNKDNHTFFGIDSKLKPSRLYLPDTGVNAKSLYHYKKIKEQLHLDAFYLFFIDPILECIYYIELNEFIENSNDTETFRQMDDGKTSFNGDVLFTRLEHFAFLKTFSAEEKEHIKSILDNAQYNNIPKLNDYLDRQNRLKQERLPMLKGYK